MMLKINYVKIGSLHIEINGIWSVLPLLVVTFLTRFCSWASSTPPACSTWAPFSISSIHISILSFPPLWSRISWARTPLPELEGSDQYAPALIIRYHQQNIGEGTSKVSSIYIMTFFLGHIHFLTSRTEDFNSGSSNFLAHSDRQNMLPFTEDPRADPEGAFEIFLSHHAKPLWRQNESGMNKPIQISCLLVNR